MQKHQCKILGLSALALTLLWGVSGPVNAQVFVLINQQVALAGGVSPGDAPGFPVTISVPGTYVLNGPLTVGGDVTAIVIEADNVVLNCDGERVTGSNSTSMEHRGILLESRRFVTVESCPVTNFRDGFVLRGSNNNVFRNNRVENNNDDGFQLENSDVNFFIQNAVRQNGDDGFDLEDSDANFFTGNNVNGNTENGFAVDDSDNNTFVQNNINNNRQHGISLDGSGMNVFVSNTATLNGGDGFRILNMSNQNTFLANRACGNRSGVDFRQTGSINNILANNSFCVVIN